MWHKNRLKLFIGSLILLLAIDLHAAKFDFYFGGFSFDAKTETTEGSKSGVGLYKINYSLPILDNFEAGLGYTLILADTIGGDALFGFDIEMSYFPFTSAGSVKLQTENTFVRQEALWKPFVMMGYAARQIQSVSTQYNGFSMGGGVERALDAKFNVKGLVRYTTMAGAGKGEATEISFMGGLSFNF